MAVLRKRGMAAPQVREGQAVKASQSLLGLLALYQRPLIRTPEPMSAIRWT